MISDLFHLTLNAQPPRININLSQPTSHHHHHLPSSPVAPFLHVSPRRLELLVTPPTEAIHVVELLAPVAPHTRVVAPAPVLARSAVMAACVHERYFVTHVACWTRLAWVCRGSEWRFDGVDRGWCSRFPSSEALYTWPGAIVRCGRLCFRIVRGMDKDASSAVSPGICCLGSHVLHSGRAVWSLCCGMGLSLQWPCYYPCSVVLALLNNGIVLSLFELHAFRLLNSFARVDRGSVE